MAVEEFKDCVPEAKANSSDKVLTDAEIGSVLTRGAELVAWYKDLEEYALEAYRPGSRLLRYGVRRL